MAGEHCSVCPHCKTDFVSDRKRKFCSDQCCYLAHHRKPPQKANCRNCGNDFEKKQSQGKKVFCSKECAKAFLNGIRGPTFTPRPCTECGATFVPRTGKGKYCSARCKRIGWRKASDFNVKRAKVSPDVRTARRVERMRCELETIKASEARAERRFKRDLARIFARMTAKRCASCGCEISRRGCLTYCPPCGEAMRKQHHRIAREAGKARRRGATVEPVNRHKVFERDGWKCQICGRPTPKRLDGTYKPNAPENDHRIPLAKGGPHSYANCQCVCRECNNMKSDKRIIGQLPLFNIHIP